MGVIVEFKPVKKKIKSDSAKRIEALIKGKIEAYTCDNCGGHFEVINDDFPTHCPCCGMEMEWDE